jgi:hypothetical protein
MDVTSILDGIQGILGCSKDIENVINEVKEAMADGKITPSEFMEILEAIVQAVSNITSAALDIKKEIE